MSLSVIDELEIQLADLIKSLTVNHIDNLNPKIKDIRTVELRRKVIGVAECALIKNILELTSNNKTLTAKLMGISKNTLLSKIKDYRISA